MKKIVFAIIILFINSQVLDDNIAVRVLPIFLFTIVIFENLIINKANFNLMDKSFYLLSLMILMIIIGIIITKRKDISLQFNIFKIATFFTFFVAFFSTIFNATQKKTPLKNFIIYAYIPFTVYILLNLVLFFLGFKNKSNEIGEAIILSYFGIAIQRVQFVLTSGINGYGALVGILFNFSLLGLWIIKKYKKLFLAGLIISLVTLLLTDSRGPIIYSVLIFLLIKFFYFKVDKPKFLWIIPLIGFLGPILMLFMLSLLAQSDYGAALSRSSEDLTTGNSRSIIWGIAASEFLSFKPEHHLFGYGEFGQYAAGLSQQWAFIFGDREGAEFMHPHNTFLSIALDYGYFGLALFTIIQFSIVKIIKMSWNSNRFISCLLLGNILYFNLVGIGETMFGFYYRNIIYIFFMINIFAFVMDYQNKNKKLKTHHV